MLQLLPQYVLRNLCECCPSSQPSTPTIQAFSLLPPGGCGGDISVSLVSIHHLPTYQQQTHMHTPLVANTGTKQWDMG